MTLKLIDPCYPPNSIVLADIADVTYTSTNDAETFGLGAVTINPSYCSYDTTVTIVPLPTPVTVALDTAITYDSTSETFTVDYNDEIDPITQTQLVTVTVTSTSDYQVSDP